MDSESAYVRQRFFEFLWSAKTRIGPVLRISAIDSAHVPAENFERRDSVLLGIRSQFGQFIEAMHDNVFTVRKDNRLPGVLFAQPIRRTVDVEMLIEPRAVNGAGGVPVAVVNLQCNGARPER